MTDTNSNSIDDKVLGCTSGRNSYSGSDGMSSENIEPYCPSAKEIILEQIKGYGTSLFYYVSIYVVSTVMSCACVHLFPSAKRWASNLPTTAQPESAKDEKTSEFGEMAMMGLGLLSGAGIMGYYVAAIIEQCQNAEISPLLCLAPLVGANLLDLGYEAIRKGYLSTKERLIEERNKFDVSDK
jgi:hypothetical protein